MRAHDALRVRALGLDHHRGVGASLRAPPARASPRWCVASSPVAMCTRERAWSSARCETFSCSTCVTNSACCRQTPRPTSKCRCTTPRSTRSRTSAQVPAMGAQAASAGSPQRCARSPVAAPPAGATSWIMCYLRHLV